MRHLRVSASLLSAAFAMTGVAAQAPPPQPQSQPRPPVFRAGAHYVRVDTYPAGKDGKIPRRADEGLDAIETRQARLLDRRGQPLPISLKLEDDSTGPPRLVTELSLAPLGRGDYLIELTVAAGTVTERKLLAVRIT